MFWSKSKGFPNWSHRQDIAIYITIRLSLVNNGSYTTIGLACRIHAHHRTVLLYWWTIDYMNKASCKSNWNKTYLRQFADCYLFPPNKSMLFMQLFCSTVKYFKFNLKILTCSEQVQWQYKYSYTLRPHQTDCLASAG